MTDWTSFMIHTVDLYESIVAKSAMGNNAESYRLTFRDVPCRVLSRGGHLGNIQFSSQQLVRTRAIYMDKTSVVNSQRLAGTDGSLSATLADDVVPIIAGWQVAFQGRSYVVTNVTHIVEAANVIRLDAQGLE